MDKNLFARKRGRSGFFSKKRSRSGFTLIEILVVVGMISFLAAIVLVAINPGRQFAQGRNAQRSANVNAILNAIGQNIADNKGVFACNVSGAVIDGTIRVIGNSAALADKTDLRGCLVPTYISEIPLDPADGENSCDDFICSGGSYDTEYTVVKNDTTGRIKICAPGALNESTLDPDGSGTETAPEICVER
jgi:type IV pilus assembly protein PilA